MTTGADGLYSNWSETLLDLTGVGRAYLPKSTREWLDLLHPADRESFRLKSIEAAASGKRARKTSIRFIVIMCQTRNAA